MKGARAELVVGIFALLVLAILSFMTFRVGEFTIGRKEGFVVYAYFRNTAGLDEKTRVKIAGVDAGVVEKIDLVNGMARVRVRLYPDVKLYSDASASIRATGLLGDKYLEIRTGITPPELKDGDRIENITEFADLDDLVRNLSSISGKLMEVIAEFSQEDLRKALRETVLNLRDITADVKYLTAENKQKINQIVARLNSISQKVDEFVSDNKAPLTRTVSNVETFSESLRDEGPVLLAKLNEVTSQLKALLDDAGPELTEVASKANRTMDSISAISNRIESGEGTIGKLVQDDQLYDSLTRAAKGLDKTLGAAERFRTFVTFRNDYLTDAKKSKGAFYLTLQPRQDKYYVLGIVKDPVGSIEVTETTTNGVYEREEKIEDKIEFTAQFAKRYYDTALRIGMTESTFGVGADQFFLDDRFVISLDAWDFNDDEKDNDKAHIRVGADYFLFRNFFLSGGYDNILNTDRRGLYLGGGLKFEDEDLKYLLGSAPNVNVN